jgi:hypothetical protein
MVNILFMLVVYALQKYDVVTIHPVNPSMLAQYRNAYCPSGVKDDPTDAELALDLILNYLNKIKALKMENESVRKLMYLVEQRLRLVEGRKRLINKDRTLSLMLCSNSHV